MKELFEYNDLRILYTFIAIAALYILRFVINIIINKKVERLKNKYIFRQTVNYVVLGAAIIILIYLWFEKVQSILTVLSIAVAAFIVISKEFFLNLIANGVIITRGLFHAGDRIQIGQYSGDVMETGPMFFSISEIGNWVHGDESTGRVIKIPNSLVLTQPVANYSRGLNLIWEEIVFELRANSNWEKAKSIAGATAKEYSYEFSRKDLSDLQKNYEEVMFTNTEPSIYLSLKDGKLLLTVRFVCKFHKRRQVYEQILEELLRKFNNEADIQLLINAG